MWEVRRSAMETNLLHFWNRCTEISRYFPVQPNTQQRRRGTPTNFSSFLVSLLRLSPPTFCSGIVTCKDGESTPTKWLRYLSSLHGWVVINRECLNTRSTFWGGGCVCFLFVLVGFFWYAAKFMILNVREASGMMETTKKVDIYM